MAEPKNTQLRQSPLDPSPRGWKVMPLSECAEVQTGVAKFSFRTFLGLKVTANAAGPTPPDIFEGVPTQQCQGNP